MPRMEEKKHEVQIRNKDKGQGLLGNRGNGLKVGNIMIYCIWKGNLEHLGVKMNTAEDKFREEGNSQCMMGFKCNDK